MKAVMRLLPEPPSEAFLPDQPLHGWMPMVVNLQNPQMRERAMALANVIGYNPDDRDLSYRFGMCPNGNLAVIPLELTPLGRYAIEEANAPE